MSPFNTDWSRIHLKKSFSPFSMFLTALSIPYGMGSRFRTWAYKRGVFKMQALPGTVVSIGNLSAGGTGKTPATVMLARWAHEKGCRVVILSRGYGGNYQGKRCVVSDGHEISARAVESGDEPLLLAKNLPDIPVILSKKRYDAGAFARERFGSNFFILDDGFQHMELARDLDLVLLDAEAPFGNGRLLPGGPLREPVSQLERAHAFIMTHARLSDRDLTDRLKKRFPNTPVFFADHVPSKVVFPFSSEAVAPTILKGKTVAAFAGIARPESFLKTLQELGATVVHFQGFRDHYPYKKQDLEALLEIKQRTRARYLITTEKDWVRMERLDAASRDMAYLTIEFKLLDRYDTFFGMIEECVHAKDRAKINSHSKGSVLNH